MNVLLTRKMNTLDTCAHDRPLALKLLVNRQNNDLNVFR